ncbi:hypothetical protein [Embleya sp. NPDC005971]|uniref:hypothetical protein n=1 Tax=Embleya sp. NPDC005971 TaxID=3156724 RepID=UPI0033DCA233
MSYGHHDLTVTYEPAKDSAHFVLYTEPASSIVAPLNTEVHIGSHTRYVLK